MAPTNSKTANQLWASRCAHWEYSSAATPDLRDVPIKIFPASLHDSGETRVIPLDLSEHLETDYLATAPGLLASYIRICANEHIQCSANASSEIFYVMSGAGYSETDFGRVDWRQGDAFSLPVNSGITHHAEEDAALAWGHDGPFFDYMGGTATEKRFEPAYYSREALIAASEDVREAGIRENRNRNGIILGNKACTKTKTMTHSMWSLYNFIPANAVQKPHRHQSVAIDLALSAGPNTYTLIGEDIDGDGNIIDPVKVPWSAHSIFVTPPGWWHSHHNEDEDAAYVFPFQDAGLHTYLRTLDIRFFR
jgi:gentisate 1,2-dioxygenase